MAGLGLEAAVMNILIGPKLSDTFGSTLGSQLDKAVGPAAEKASASLSEKLSDGFNKAGGALTKGLTAPILAIGGAAVAAGMEIDGAFDAIRVGTGATGDALEGLKDDFREVAKNSAADLGRVGQVVADLNTRLGITGEPLQDLAQQLVDLEQITGEAANLDTLTRVLAAFNVPTEEAVATFDRLFRASQASGVGFGDLTTKLVSQSAAFAELGFGLDETAALLAQFEKAGVNTDTVLGALRVNIVKAAKEGKSASQFFRDGVKEIEGFLQSGDDAAAQARASELFGARTFLDALDAIKRGQFNIDDTLEAMREGEDTISGLADETADFPERMKQLKNSLILAAEPIANVLIPAITDLIDAALPAIEKFADAFRNLDPRIQKTIVVVGGLAAAIGPVLLVAGKVIGVFQQVTTVFRTLSAVLAANPWVLVAAAAVAAVVLIVKNWDTIVAFFKNLWSVVKAGFVGLWNGITAGARSTVGALAGILRSIISVVSTVVNAIAGGFRAAWNAVTGAFRSAYDTIAGIVNRIKGLIDGVVNGIKNLPGTIASGLDSLTGGAFGAVADIFRADGGPVDGGKPYIVGEVGPELFMPRTAGTVVSNADLASMLGSGGGGDSYSITIVNPVAEPASTSIPNALRKTSYLRN
jgi:TP901 family phage tail tape measure protein